MKKILLIALLSFAIPVAAETIQGGSTTPRVVAAGRIEDDGTITNEFGLRASTRTATGFYDVSFDLITDGSHFVCLVTPVAEGVLLGVGNGTDVDGFGQCSMHFIDRAAGADTDVAFRIVIVIF